MALTLVLFIAGSFPATGQAFPGLAHWIAHLVGYAMIAIAYSLGWQKQPSVSILGIVAALGAIHECSEIFSHHHALEIADVLVNSIGAGIGAALARGLAPAARSA